MASITGFILGNLVGSLLSPDSGVPDAPSRPKIPKAVEPKGVSAEEASQSALQTQREIRRARALSSQRSFSSILKSTEEDSVTVKSLLGR